MPGSTGNVLQTILDAIVKYIDDHKNNAENPHKVTAAQVGAYTKEQTDSAINGKIVEIGGGDMQQAVYDPTGKRKDIFAETESLEKSKMSVSVYDPQNKKEDIFSYGPHLYKATFLLDGWSGGGPYTQTVSVQAVDGGPAITDQSHMTSALFFDDTVQGDARSTLQEAAALVDGGTKTFGSGTITCVIQDEKPTADAEVFFNARKGVS